MDTEYTLTDTAILKVVAPTPDQLHETRLRIPAQMLEDDRDQTDAELGMAWWNNLNEVERLQWLERANSAAPADAWAEFKRSGSKTIQERCA
jgi:hypothetical protein